MSFKVGDIVVWDPEASHKGVPNMLGDTNGSLYLELDLTRHYTVIEEAVDDHGSEMRLTDGVYTARSAPWRWKKVADASVWIDVEPRRLP